MSNVTVHGTIASYSRVYKKIKSITVKCESCSSRVSTPFDISVLDYPSNIFKKCIQCGENLQEIVEEYVNAIKIEIQAETLFA